MNDTAIVFVLMLIPTSIISTIWVILIDKANKKRTQRNERVH